MVVSSISNSTPEFMASQLIPGTAYSIRVLASTPSGNSSVVTFRAFTVKTAEKRMGKYSQLEDSYSFWLGYHKYKFISEISVEFWCDSVRPVTFEG